MTSCSRAVVLVLVLAAPPALAQPAAPTAPQPAQAAPGSPSPPASPWRATLTNITRFESWSFFTPPPGGGDPDSNFVGNRLRAGLSRSWPRVDIAGALQYVQFGGLPDRAVGPGFLGTGGLYYFHAGSTTSHGVYVPALNVRFKLPHGVTLLAGRFGYTSGAEAPSGDARIETIKRSRADSRLIGDFEWSLYQRSFDGVRGDVDRRSWHLTAAYLKPTQGGFEEDAGARLGPVGVGAVTMTWRPGALVPKTDVAAFAYYYGSRGSARQRGDRHVRRLGDRQRAVTWRRPRLVRVVRRAERIVVRAKPPRVFRRARRRRAVARHVATVGARRLPVRLGR